MWSSTNRKQPASLSRVPVGTPARADQLWTSAGARRKLRLLCFARFKNVKLGRRVGNAFTAGVYFGTGDGLASLKMSWRLTGKMHY